MKVRKAVFPVAGLGTRFLPATKAVPKEMLAVVDKPLIQYAVEEAREAGIEQFIFVTGRDKGAMESHFDYVPELEQNLKSRDKEALLKAVRDVVPDSGTMVYTRQNLPHGLGHAVWCARELVGREPFAVILPDDLVHAEVPVLKQMVEQFEQYEASIVAVREVARGDTDKYGILDVEGGPSQDTVVRVRGLVEKPSPENAPSTLAIIGRYILMPEIFPLLGQHREGAGGEVQLTDAMAQLLVKQSLYGYRFEGTRFDCGSKTGFQMANLYYALERSEMRSTLLPFMQEQLAKWHSPQN
ncbi:MAG: UTP--glucose-1-phosphate uridylyltransferase GalU [Magnetococcales bacterium]|nr:UTP--glucose-1-phosphate uridylyltransferase GalU [Magnetococcales bacterium]